MENSPANRLPEVDSLPDGFVEGSADPAVDTSPPDYKDALPDMEQPEEPGVVGIALPADGTAEIERPEESADLSVDSGVPSGDGPDGSKGVMKVAGTQSKDEQPTGTAQERDGRECANSDGGETEGCLELHTSLVVERSVAEPECPKNKKMDASETKRKVKKSSIKPEKELLELTLKYHRVIAERDSAVAVREKLESLCRELQRQNKILMEECQRVSTEGHNMRSDLSTKFNNAIKDVSSKLEEQKDDYLSQLKENEMLRDRLKHLADQYTLSEQHFAQKLKQKMLELQLADLKIQQHQEKSTKEQTQMQLYVEQVTQLLETEKNLRLQLAADGEKFQQFQDALLKSNEVFETFKQEMEKMAKLIKDLKKENVFLKSKCEKSDFSLIKLVEEREAMKKQLEKLKNQKEKLESLCRSLQAERKQNSTGASNSDLVAPQVKTGPADEDS